MKFLICRLLLALFIAISVGCLSAADAAKGSDKAKGAKKGKLHHVVSFKFKKSATPDQIQKVVDDFLGLKKSIKEISGFRYGKNSSPEKHDKGFTHMWVLLFESDKDRDAYLVHPAHKEFGSKLGPVLEDVFVIDFWNED